MLKLGQDKESLNIVSDQIGAPTSAAFLANMTKLAIDKGVADGFNSVAGLYHLTNSGETSWHGFATEIFRQARERGATLAIKTVNPIPTSDYPTPARRPLNSRLDCSKFKKVFGVSDLQKWEEALNLVMQQLAP
jgi:dTDP-4-dehydrorhamnose reductase